MKPVLLKNVVKTGGGASELTPKEALARTHRRLERERRAREEAETLLESKSLELYQASAKLKELNVDLQHQITEVDLHVKKAEYAADHCELTTLANRRAISHHLEKVFDEDWTLIIFDLDRFKRINDTLGHAAGDAVLRAVGTRLIKYFGDTHFYGRLGGDEFIVMINEGAQSSEVEKIVADLHKVVGQPVLCANGIARFSLSIGVSRRHPGQRTPDDISFEADLALYDAKQSGRGRSVFFNQEMRVEAARRRRISELLFEALEQKQFMPYYMPRIDAVTGEVKCVEALARWKSPELGHMLPDEFLGIAEDIGQLAAIDRQIFETAANDWFNWQAAGVAIPKFSVNVSSRRLMDPQLSKSVREIDLPEGALAFELLETVFLDDASDLLKSRLDALRALGVGIEIDDFGSGHASINGLLAIRPQTLKIDRHLVTPALKTRARTELLASVVAIGKALNIDVVAEGVETKDHIDLCRSLGCGQLQGWAIAKPMPCHILIDWLKKR